MSTHTSALRDCRNFHLEICDSRDLVMSTDIGLGKHTSAMALVTPVFPNAVINTTDLKTLHLFLYGDFINPSYRQSKSNE